MTQKWRVASLASIVLTLITVLTSACYQELSAWDQIQEAGVLRVGLDPTYPPFEFLDGDDVKGIDVDLMQSISDDLGIKVEFTYFGYDGLYDALATNQVDVLASALVISVEKTRDFAYTTSYFDAGQVLVSRVDNPHNQPASLSESILAVELGSQGHVEATIWQRQIRNLEITPFTSTAEALEAVDRGMADAALVDHIGAVLFVSRDDGLIISPEPVTEEPFALVVLADQTELIDILNTSLARITRDHQLQAILDKWLNTKSSVSGKKAVL